jgi:hypothetical protein
LLFFGGRQTELRLYLVADGRAELNDFVVDLYIGRIEVLLIYIVVSVCEGWLLGVNIVLHNVKKSLHF